MRILGLFLVLMVLAFVAAPAPAADIVFTPGGPVVVNNHATSFFSLSAGFDVGPVGCVGGCGVPSAVLVQRAPVFRDVIATPRASVTVVNEQRGLLGLGRSRTTVITNGGR